MSSKTIEMHLPLSVAKKNIPVSKRYLSTQHVQARVYDRLEMKKNPVLEHWLSILPLNCQGLLLLTYDLQELDIQPDHQNKIIDGQSQFIQVEVQSLLEAYQPYLLPNTTA